MCRSFRVRVREACIRHFKIAQRQHIFPPSNKHTIRNQNSLCKLVARHVSEILGVPTDSKQKVPIICWKYSKEHRLAAPRTTFQLGAETILALFLLTYYKAAYIMSTFLNLLHSKVFYIRVTLQNKIQLRSILVYFHVASKCMRL